MIETTTIASFEQAMLETPNDLALRQVFADWLEERGDPRGELLRLTDALTQSIDVPRRAELESRMHTLVDEGIQAIGPFCTNSIGMRFTWIPPGTFMMGSPERERGRNDDEQQHRITLTNGFALGLTPITQAQWQAIVGDNPSHFKGDQLPVESATWFDAVQFCNALSAKDNRQPYYRINSGAETVEISGGNGYRLPTEAEWEYACRAGSTTAYYFGNDVGKLGEHAWFSDNSSSQTHSVGQKKANAWGLHDMHGNVWEWCWDWYGEYPAKDTSDPQGLPTEYYRVLRGGSWYHAPRNLRSARRNRYGAGLLSVNVGFRVAC